jgi:YidC/Oxa1 family membrane protein insertase
MYRWTRKQLNATKAMQTLQPKLAELQKKHAKDKQKLAEEQMKLYKESGVSPTGCLLRC